MPIISKMYWINVTKQPVEKLHDELGLRRKDLWEKSTEPRRQHPEFSQETSLSASHCQN